MAKHCRLKEISTSPCCDSFATSANLFNHCPLLTKLEIEAEYITREGFLTVATCRPLLRYFHSSCQRNLNDDVLTAIGAGCLQLTDLIISMCCEATDIGIRKLSKTCKMVEIVKLVVS